MSSAPVLVWGRAAAEYEAFFDLADLPPGRRILDCGGGPSSFNAEMTARGHRVVSVDPLYALDGAEIARRIAAGRETVLAPLRAEPDRFVWTHHADVDALVAARDAAMRAFLADYPNGRCEGRYLEGALPDLPPATAADAPFDLALSSHLLFLYSDSFDADVHCAAVDAMAATAREVRIFPLLDMAGRRSAHLDAVLSWASGHGLVATLEPVAYEFQRGATEMLRIRR